MKNYILDTNILLLDPHSIFKFQDNNVIIPLVVIEEVDKFKHESSERGRNAREVSRLIDNLRHEGSLISGVAVGEGTLRIHTTYDSIISVAPNSPDSLIIGTALNIERQDANIKTILITNDANLRIRADIFSIEAESYQNQSVKIEESDSTVIELNVEKGDIDYFYSHKELGYDQRDGEIYQNANIMMVSTETGHKYSALGRLQGTMIRPLLVGKEGVLGIKPRNAEQTFALDMLLDDKIKLVNLIGLAGSGKSMLSIVAGLQKVLIEGKFTKFLATRPIVPMGKDLGYLPGELSEKLQPWSQAVYDNLDFIVMNKELKKHLPANNKGVVNLDKVFEDGIIQIEALTYIRGRSISGAIILADEMQNANLHETKTLISRCGEGTKIILAGDPQQIDNPYVNSSSNGLSIAFDKLKGEPIVAGIKLAKCERSELAELAANKL